MVLDGDHGGHVTASHLMLTLTAQHHGAVVTCEAFNEIVGKKARESIVLSVHRKLPKFGMIKGPRIAEKDFLDLILSYKCLLTGRMR